MINLDNFAAIGEYVLVKKDQPDDINSIVIVSGEGDKVLRGKVLSAETYDDIMVDDDGEQVTWIDETLGNYRRDDIILFNRMKSLPVVQNVDEEIYIVRREDIFGAFIQEES